MTQDKELETAAKAYDKVNPFLTRADHAVALAAALSAKAAEVERLRAHVTSLETQLAQALDACEKYAVTANQITGRAEERADRIESLTAQLARCSGARIFAPLVLSDACSFRASYRRCRRGNREDGGCSTPPRAKGERGKGGCIRMHKLLQKQWVAKVAGLIIGLTLSSPFWMVALVFLLRRMHGW